MRGVDTHHSHCPMPIYVPFLGIVGYDRINACDHNFSHSSYLGTTTLTHIHGAILYGGMVAHLALHHVIRYVLRASWSFDLSEKNQMAGQTKEKFLRETTINIQGVLLHSYLGPAAVYAAWRSQSTQSATETAVIHQALDLEGCKSRFQSHLSYPTE